MGQAESGSVEDQEREKYEYAWTHDSYRERSPGMRFLEDALKRLQPHVGASILDIGCGTGRVSRELSQRGFDVTALDIASNACQEFDGPFIHCPVWDIPDVGVFDYGYCADVMEHLPTEKVEAAIRNIARVCEKVYFQIANFHDHGEMIGGGVHLHLTVKDLGWWAEMLAPHFKKVDIRPQPKHHIAVCTTR